MLCALGFPNWIPAGIIQGILSGSLIKKFSGFFFQNFPFEILHGVYFSGFPSGSHHEISPKCFL